MVIYCCRLAAADRFLDHSLVEGELFSIGGFMLSAAVLGAIGLFAWRLTQARMMVTQYPWRYEPAGPFGCAKKGIADARGVLAPIMRPDRLHQSLQSERRRGGVPAQSAKREKYMRKIVVSLTAPRRL